MTSLNSSTIAESSRENKSPAFDRSFFSNTCSNSLCILVSSKEHLFEACLECLELKFRIIKMHRTCSITILTRISMMYVVGLSLIKCLFCHLFLQFFLSLIFFIHFSNGFAVKCFAHHFKNSLSLWV